MNITPQNGRWIVTMSWLEAHKAYEERSPAKRAISTVAEERDVDRDHLRSSIIRAQTEGMTVVVEKSNG